MQAVDPKISERILELASRPGGVAASEVRNIADCEHSTARKLLRRMEHGGKLISASGGYNGRQLRWFTDRSAAKTWAETSKRFAPAMAMPIAKPAPVTKGIASGCDPRYQLTPAEREQLRTDGEFSAEWKRLRA